MFTGRAVQQTVLLQCRFYCWLPLNSQGCIVCGLQNGLITICTFYVDRMNDLVSLAAGSASLVLISIQMVPTWTTLPAHQSPVLHISSFNDRIFLTATRSEICLWTLSDSVWVSGPLFSLSSHANG